MTAMPYIVTMKRPEYDDKWQLVPGGRIAFRRAVATLEEIYSAGILGRGVVLPESGGTVGPLPDGTVIEVEQISWFDVAKTTIDDLDRALYNAMAAPLSEKYPGVAERLLEAFNARESSQ